MWVRAIEARFNKEKGVATSCMKRPRSDSTDSIYDNASKYKRPDTKRAKLVDERKEYLDLKTADQNVSPNAPNCLFLFRKDLRLHDNRALKAASWKARQTEGILFAVYLSTPREELWHGTSPARYDLIAETLDLLRTGLAELHIPLVILTASKRSQKTEAIMRFVEEYSIGHIFANLEVEIDEIRRDRALMTAASNAEVRFMLFEDQTVVPPDQNLTTQKYFKPFLAAWNKHVDKHSKLLELASIPESNEQDVRDSHTALFEWKGLDVPESRQFKTDSERITMRKLWPAGHEAAQERLQHFLKDKVKDYRRLRSTPGSDSSSRLSPYISLGIISIRELVSQAKSANGGTLDKGDASIKKWVRELVFREYYRQSIVARPHNSMNLPDVLAYDKMEWTDDPEGWKRWCEGTTGVPFVDAGMRQLAQEGWLHNRARMVVASYLRGNLGIDYRKGERYFAEHLIDYDLSNNHFGWTPTMTILNPVLQSRKCDPDGTYIKKWVPELASLDPPALYAPQDHLSAEELKQLGYIVPHVDYMTSRRVVTAKCKAAMSKN